MLKTLKIALSLSFLSAASSAMADPNMIEEVKAAQGTNGWNISVTVSHADTGWEHYTDGWEVLAADGERIGFRELLHPHVSEQPFTRSLSSVLIPADAETITIRAHCSVDGWVGEPYVLTLDR